VRTTVDLDPDIIQVVRTLARDRNQTMGRTLSELARLGLHSSQATQAESRNGIPLLPRRTAEPVTTEMVRALLDTED
jgi:hypothetical protein